MEYICQLGEGYMLVKDNDGNYNEYYTGYPYPDTSKSNIEALQEIFDTAPGTRLGDDIYENPKKYMERVRSIIHRHGGLTLSGLRNGDTQCNVLMEWDNWLYIQVKSNNCELCRGIHTDIVGSPIAEHQALLIHEDNANIERLGKLNWKTKSTMYLSIFNLCTGVDDVYWLRDDIIDTDSFNTTYYKGLVIEKKLKYLLKLGYAKDCWDTIKVSDISKETRNLLYSCKPERVQEVVNKEINNKLLNVVSSEISWGINVGYTKPNLLVYRSEKLEYAWRGTNASDIRQSAFGRRAIISYNDDEVVMDLMKVCGHELLCPVVYQTYKVFHKSAYVKTTNIINKGYNIFKTYMKDWDTRYAREALCNVNFTDWSSKLFKPNNRHYYIMNKACSPLMNFLFELRGENYNPVAIYCTGRTIVVEMYPLSYFPERLLEGADIEKLCSDNTLDFIKVAAHYVMFSLLRDDGIILDDFDLSEDLWNISYTVNGANTRVVVVYGAEV